MDGYRFVNRIPGYHYTDTPEDEDCLKKVIFMNKLGLWTGFFAGTLDVVALSKPVGIANIAGRYGVITLPLLATGSAFAAATCLTANYRGKLDYQNSMVGGFVAGCTLGGVLRHAGIGAFSSVMFTILAYAIGSAKDMGVTPWITPDEKIPLEFGGFWSIKYDWSLIKERPKAVGLPSVSLGHFVWLSLHYVIQTFVKWLLILGDKSSLMKLSAFRFASFLLVISSFLQVHKYDSKTQKWMYMLLTIAEIAYCSKCLATSWCE